MNGKLTTQYKDWADKQDSDRYQKAKAMIMAYPHYTDEHRQSLIDAIGAADECRKQACINARIALEEAFKNHKK